MAGQEPQYYEQPADQEYYGEEEYPMEGGGASELSPIAGVPWIAIVFALHLAIFGVLWFIYPPALPVVKVEVIQSDVEPEAIPPEPEQEPEEEVEFPKDEPVQEDPTEDPRITEDATDDNNEDPSDQPNNDLAENPNDTDSQVDSPHPNKTNSNSSVGLGGGAGGGGGRGGAGGFAHRRARGGGGSPTDSRVKAALEWLKDHQNIAGHWSATDFGKDSTRKGAKHTWNIEHVQAGVEDGDIGWEHSVDVGLSGMSLLAFVGAGYDHKAGEYKRTVRNSIKYLRKVQSNDGCFGAKQDDHFVYNHAICTMAIAEAYGLSMDKVLKPSCDRAIQFILNAQNPGMGWRYGIQPKRNDSSVTGWMVLALKSCKMANLDFDYHKSYDDAAKWFETVTIDVNGYPKTGYDSPGSDNARLRDAGNYDNNPSMDSIYVMSMLFMEKADTSDRKIKAMSKTCIERGFLPSWELSKIDYYWWYYSSLALYQVGGSYWSTWEKSMVKTLMDYQRGYHAKDKEAGLTTKEQLDEHGSWDAVDAWSAAGGRVYATAINCLTLEVYYRYQRIEKEKKK